MPSQTAAQTKFDQVVANETNAGYTNASSLSSLVGKGNVSFFSPGDVSPMGTVKSEWVGVNVQTASIVAVYVTARFGRRQQLDGDHLHISDPVNERCHNERYQLDRHTLGGDGVMRPHTHFFVVIATLSRSDRFVGRKKWHIV